MSTSNNADDDAFTSVTWDRQEDTPILRTPYTGGLSDIVEAPSSSSSNPASASAVTTTTNVGTAILARETRDEEQGERPTWHGYLLVQVCDARKENEGTKEMFVSYGIRAETNLSHYHRTHLTTRRRFQDFVFLRENLKRDFPACLVAPLPDKHRLEYFTGDRFSAEFIERRQADLQLFLERICRHPTLQRAQLLRTFLESTEWHVDMHTHVSSSTASTSDVGSGGVGAPHGSAPGGILENISDTLLNAFTKPRKPDEKFEAIRERLERLEEGLTSTERVVARSRARHGGPPPLSMQFTSSSSAPSHNRATSLASRLWTSLPSAPTNNANNSTHVAYTPALSSPLSSPILYAPGLGLDPIDLAADYEELAAAIEGLGYLESGITEPLNKFAGTNLEWARMQRQLALRSTDDMLAHVNALLSYSSSHRSVLRLRDQKQVEFEELTDYLSSVVTERDRLASLSSPYGAGHGHGGVRGAGITGYLRDKVDTLRGVDEERTRVQRMQRLDGRIQELQTAVTQAHDESVDFSAQVARENVVFDMAKEKELRDVLATYADGQIETFRRGEAIWEAVMQAWPDESEE